LGHCQVYGNVIGGLQHVRIFNEAPEDHPL